MSAATLERKLLSLETPEHVPIGFEIAELGTRLGALLIDLFLIFGALIAAFFAMVFFFGTGGGPTVAAIFLLAMFLWRNFYFTAAEIRGRGRTPGKRILRLRVVARDGGPLTAEQIFARNLTRDLEIFLPLTLALAPELLIGDGPWWVRLATVVWVLVLSALPFTNSLRSRLGDLVAGTVVVVEPGGELLEDLSGDERTGGEEPAYRFTPRQLDIYGIHELQVLEEVLRRPPSDEKEHLLMLISAKVVAKIGWPDLVTRSNAEAFLKAFYAAQRHRLEHKMLLGKRQERKAY